MIFCDRNNIEVPLPIPNLDEKLLKRITCTDGKVRTIRLLTFVPGRLFMEVSPSFDLLFQAGAFVGRFSLVFRVCSLKCFIAFILDCI